jgi:hypothetical protein
MTDYTITNSTQFSAINNDKNGNYVLANDIDYGGGTIPVICTWTNKFNGTLDGKGFKVYNFSNISVGNAAGSYSCGVIQVTDGSAVIKNLSVQGTADAGSTSSRYLRGGMLVGNNDGTIQDCYSTGTFTANGKHDYAGGLVGYNQGTGTIKRCYSTCTVVGYNSSDQQGSAGGLCGNFYSGTISNCFATGAVTAYTNKGFGLTNNSPSTSYYSGSPQYGGGTYVATASDLYDVTHNVYDTGTYPWFGSRSTYWSKVNDTTGYPTFKASLTGKTISGSVTSLGDSKAMKLIVTPQLGGSQVVYSCNSSSDTFSFTSVAYREGDMFLIFVDTATSSEDSNLVGYFDTTGNITGITMVKGELSIGYSDAKCGDGFTQTDVASSWYNDGDVSFTVSSGAITTRNDVNVILPENREYTQNSAFTVSNGDLNIDGTWTCSATLTAVDYVIDGTLTATAVVNADNLTINGEYTNTAQTNTDFLTNNGTTNIGRIIMSDDCTNTDTMTIKGGQIGTIDNSGTFTKASLGGGDGTLEVADLTNSGTFNMNNTMDLQSSFDNTGGTFNANSSTVNLTTGTCDFLGDVTFNNLTRSGAGTLTFENGKTYTIGGTLSLSGTNEDLLVIQSDSAGDRFTFDVASETIVTYVSVKDSECDTSSILVRNGVNLGNTDFKESAPHWNFQKTLKGATTIIRPIPN